MNTDFLSEQTLVPFRWQSRCLCCTAETEEKYQTKSVKEEVLRTGRICNCSPHKTKVMDYKVSSKPKKFSVSKFPC